jgi:hypothetical protein
MKQLNHYFFILVALALMLASCSKNAPGPQKPQGAPGKTSVAATAGPDGTTIYSGATTPPAATGNNGDFYLDLSTWELYGPKTLTGWGTGIYLNGGTGAIGGTTINDPSGNPASQVYSGIGPPAANFGNIGDYYLDKSTYLLYGPKTASGWGTPIQVQAPSSTSGVQTDQFSIGGVSWLWNSQYVFETSTGSYTEYFTRYYTRLNNSVTQNVLDYGMVLVYFTPSPVNNPNQWEPLPYQFDSSFGFTYNYVYVTAPGQVTLHYFFIETDPTATLPTLSTYNDEVRKFKIVTVSGTTGSFMLSHHVNLNDYNAVARVTGIWQQDR